MKEENLKLQLKAIDYMESTYGKKWEKRLMQSSPAITNAYISGYKDRGNEDITATKFLVSQKRFDRIGENVQSAGHEKDFEKLFGFPVEVERKLPDNLGCMVDGEMNVVSFIEFEEKI